MRPYSLCTTVLALGLGLLGGCGETAAPEGSTGSLNLNLQLADGLVINEVAWTISGGDMAPMEGTIDTSAPGATASVEVFGLPPGEDYLVELEATDESGQVPCQGDAEFDVEVGVSTDVMVMLNCKRPTNLGGVRVNGELNVCAQIAKVVVSPLQTSVGNVIDLSALGEDVEGDDISYAWTATGGSIADASAKDTTYTCEEVGEHAITITVSDDDGEYCMDDWTVSVTCVDPPDCIDLIDFPHGVAAGDIDQSSVVLWARPSFEGTVRFEWGTDPQFRTVDPSNFKEVEVDGPIPGGTLDDPDEGTIVGEPDDIRDTDDNPHSEGLIAIPVKHRITDLVEGTQYYYRACNADSCPSTVPRGCKAPARFRTPYADGTHRLRFGVSSCFQQFLRPFVAIRNVPGPPGPDGEVDAKDNLDFFVALGDTVYADNRDTGCSVAAGRPRSERTAFSLNDFRCKYEKGNGPPPGGSQDDNMFRLARASTAFFATIDDHEVVNDFAGGAPPNSLFRPDNVGGGRTSEPFCYANAPNGPDPNCALPFTNETDHFKNALQAFEEYNPSREETYGATGDPRTAGKRKLYRYRTFGKDAALFMLDTRSFRDEALLPGVLPVDAYLPWRTMLGSEQLKDLKNDLLDAEADGITWKFVLVPSPIQVLGPIGGADRFEGYAYERAVILDFIEFNCIRNVVFISGDIHGTIANNLTYKFKRLDNQRYSASWDISTGPGAYTDWFGELKLSALKVALRVQRLQLLPPLNLQGFPQTGLDRDNFHFLQVLKQLSFYHPLLVGGEVQRWNRNIPATLAPESSYTAVETFGWTEFEIDPGTQKLTVTTWGVPGYAGVGNLDLKPSPVSKFEVASVEVAPRCSGCKDNSELCLAGRDSTCCSGICYAGQCSACKPIDALCLAGDDSTCCSGICYFGQCSRCRPNGDPCLAGVASSCCSGVCGFPSGANPALRCGACKPKGAPCLLGNDDACCSGSCSRSGIDVRRCD